jgi:anti-sigma regulatory factor (Ser/Thr protein kinase)
VTAARLALSDLDNHVDPSIAFDVRLLVSELVTNSVKHAQVSEDDSIMLNVRIADAVVRVEVCDNGPGFEPPATASPPGEVDEGGLGIAIIRALVDELHFETAGSGSRLRFTKYLA